MRPQGNESSGTPWERKRPGLSLLVRESGRKVQWSALRPGTRRQHALRAGPACLAVPPPLQPQCSLCCVGAQSSGDWTHRDRDLRTTTPRRLCCQATKKPLENGRGWVYPNSFPTPEGTRGLALPEVPGSGSRVWAELPGWSRASLRLRWRRSIQSLPKESCSCRRRHLLGTMVPGLPRSFRRNWQRSELRSKVRSVGVDSRQRRPAGEAEPGYPGDPGAGRWGQTWAAGLLDLTYRFGPVLCPAGSREELVERLQTYTRQVSGVGGMSE